MFNLIFALCCLYTTCASAQLSLRVIIAQQTMHLEQDGTPIKNYIISTSGYGIGGERNSNRTPLGKHRVVCKVGAGAPQGTIFKTAINTKKKAPIFRKSVPMEKQQDLITTRVIQLEGLEERNKHSYQRGIWIHGTPYEGDIGTACSHGCVRMYNKDICELYEYIKPGMLLDIVLK